MPEDAKGPATRAAPEIELAGPSGRGVGHLGPFLAWAVVFADLGTSVFYVPAILYAQVGAAAPWFVLVVSIAFIFVAFGHLTAIHRYPQGGGGVSAALEAFGPRVAVLSGALMVGAYLITIGISVVSALHYIAAIEPFRYEIPILSVVAIVLLGALHWVGMRELARAALALAIAALVFEGGVVAAILVKLDVTRLFQEVLRTLREPAVRHWSDAAAGIAATWLAFSGLESLAQLAPALREPRRRVTKVVSAMVVISLLVTVPIFTVITVEAARVSQILPQAALVAVVAETFGGRTLLVLMSLTAAAFLLIAANVAFIGCYNVFKAVGELGYLPAMLASRNNRFGTPRGAVLVITVSAMVLVIATGGRMLALGKIFAFGLLGSYAITSVSLMVLAWRERRYGTALLVHGIASVALLFPWVTSLYTKPKSTLYGVLTTGFQLAVAFVTHRGWIRSGRFGFLRAASAERAASAGQSANEVVTLEEAVALKAAYPSTTLIALRGRNANLCSEAVRRARGAGDAAVYVIFVEEVPGLFFPPRTGPSDEALEVFDAAVADVRAAGLEAVPIWRLAHDAGASIAEAAEELGVRCVMMGTTARSAVWQFLRGDVLKRLLSELPEPVHVVICE